MNEASPQKVDVKDPLVRRALTVVSWLKDPALPGLVLMASLVIGGAIAFYFGWRGVARTIYVPLQLPLLVSAGIGGLALVGLGLALFDTQMTRRELAAERRHNDELLHEIALLMVLAPKLRARRTRGQIR